MRHSDLKTILNRLFDETLDQSVIEDDINTLMTQLYSTLDSVRFNVYSEQVTTFGKVGLLKSLITNIIIKIIQLDYIPLENFAKLAKVKPELLKRRLNAGELPGIRLKNNWYIRRSELWHFPEYMEDDVS